MKDELVLLQGAAHLHLITSTLAEESCHTLSGEAESHSSRVTLWIGWKSGTGDTNLQEMNRLRDASILTDVDQDPSDFIHEAGCYLRILHN